MLAGEIARIREELTFNYSKSTCARIAKSTVQDKTLLKAVVKIVVGDDATMAQRAAWILGSIEDSDTYLLNPHMPDLLRAIRKGQHDAVARNVVRVWQYMPIPEKYLGEVYEICLGFLGSPHVAIAIRAFSATVCGNICKRYPELAEELKQMIPVWSQDSSPAIRVRLRELSKLLNK